MVHSLFSIVAPVVGHDPVEVREPDLAFADLPGVHFASVVVFDGPAGDVANTFPRYVVLESCIDGAVDEYLEALVFAPKRRAALATLFSRCRGFDEVRRHPPDSEHHRIALFTYLKEHVLEPELFHIGSPGLRVDHITSGDALRLAFDREIRSGNLAHEPPLRVADEMRRRLRVPDSSTRTDWHLDLRTTESRKYAWFSDRVVRWPSRLLRWGKLGLATIALVVAAIALVYWAWTSTLLRTVILGGIAVSVAIWWVSRRLQKERKPPEIDPEALNALKELEDQGLHNHMASLVLLKPGLFRRIAIRVVLRGLNLVYRTWFTDVTPGRLMGLPTIHFAQWSIVPLTTGDDDGPRREALLFLSNYDGSWESYLDDFLSHLLYPGVIAIWSHAETSPRPLDGRIFKRWARTRMTPSVSWYNTRYPRLSVSNIQNNERLRLGLFSPPRTDHEARLWLARLGATMTGDEEFDEVAGPLPAHDMQGIVLRGFGSLPHAAYALLRIEAAEPARQWLKELVGEITDARELDRRDRARETRAVNVAFTHSALEALGVPRAVRERFPLAFRDGVAPTQNGRALHHRSRILGDIDGSAPEGWLWGARGDPDRRADVLLMMFAASEQELDAARQRLVQPFLKTGAGAVVHVIASGPSNGLAAHNKTIDHFGFVDGLSQPQIEGTWHAGRRLEEGATPDVLKPGEFILGYQSGDGSTTPGIAVEPALDPGRLLPLALGDSDLRDFGRNGTFLVARQLAQDVVGFRTFTARAAAVSPAAHASHAAEVVAARIVGRWRSGTPLIESAGGDPNAFTYASDPLGFQCPIGAHIRRANPRDSLQVDRPAAQASANRHRLLRRGRPYGRPLPDGELDDDGESRGMMFICLNADIERQFEFVQQNWINNPTFGGLYAEQDPLVGAICPPAHLTVQANAVCQRFDGLSRFVSVRGGGYFFLPGMSALRYLARLDPAALPQAPVESPVASLAPPRQSALRAALTALSRVLPVLGGVWTARFPLLIALALILLPLAPAWVPRIALPMFLTTAGGALLIAFLASTAAWTTMVTLRLVLMYGTRNGLRRPRWTKPATWKQVLAFQLLALPVVIAAVHYTALDFAGGGDGVSYWQVASRLAWASGAGLALGILSLGVATAIQSLRPGTRAGLFAPPLPLVTRIVRWASRLPLIDRLSGVISRVSETIVGNVPEPIGVGYIDYRRRRLLPGHAFAAVLAGLVCFFYAAGFFLLNPSRDGFPQAPPVAYALFMLIAIGWILSAASFFLDRYRVPTLPAVAVWIIAVATIAGADHVFDVGGPIEPAATPAEMMAAQQHGGNKIIVVASEGYALASSAWTAEVLTRLAEGPQGRQFADAVRLISASSGATLATTHFVNAYGPDGFDTSSTLTIRANASAPASADAWWGLVYPDFMRTFVPFVVPATADRGWAIEQAWKRAFADGRGPSLSAWRKDVADGWRPATVFGVTSAETGERGLLATYHVPARNSRPDDFVTGGRDVDLVTAARLSAGFPYVSPISRAATDRATSLHFTDGGFWDNSGVLPVLEWIEEARQSEKVLLIEIRSSPRREQPPPESRPWILETIGPLRTLVEVRYDGHAARTEEAFRQFALTHPVERVVFNLDDPRVSFTWNLGRTDLRYIAEVWNRGDNRDARLRVRDYLNEQ